MAALKGPPYEDSRDIALRPNDEIPTGRDCEQRRTDPEWIASKKTAHEKSSEKCARSLTFPHASPNPRAPRLSRRAARDSAGGVRRGSTRRARSGAGAGTVVAGRDRGASRDCRRPHRASVDDE